MARLIKDRGKTQKRIRPQEFAKALGAEESGLQLDTRRGPISLFTLRDFLVRRLTSTGGRPRLQGTRKARSKISPFDEDWEKIKLLTRYYREKAGINVTPSQVAAALLHAEVSRIDTSKIKLKAQPAEK